MKNRANIFYFMHISWKWAKQRPQFLAECLSKDYFVNVVQKKDYRGKNFEGKLLKHIKLIYLFLLPYNSRSKLSRFFNTIIIKLFYGKSYFGSKIIWVTSPELYWILPKRKPTQLLVYDCMDDMLSFDDIKNNPKIYDFYKTAERKLLSESDIVFSSSAHLKDVLIQRYKLKKEIHVVNNGLTLNIPLEDNGSENILRRHQTKVNLVYIGTVSKWMDWDLILASLKNDNSLLYHIVGPIEYDGPKHERIIYYGSIDHHRVFQVMSQADILIMPFVVNDLIKSVNPVKLYEYIYSGKAVLSVNYPETEKFSEFVWLYNGVQEYCQLLTHIKRSQFASKKSHLECKEFCESNNWESRYNVIKPILTSVRF
ncbi:MAG: glycosyltransferase [Sphingobacterium sp.]|jgi:glycosyltransferase involved in cell wall biosynthesis|nr:glycosyltransferase [Sphingobacterium sp.]